MQAETLTPDLTEYAGVTPGPIVKWVGGKNRLLSQMRPLFPPQFNTYYEPFCGGAAVFFDLQPFSARLNDRNRRLIQLYADVKNNIAGLIERLQTLQTAYDVGLPAEREALFYRVRQQLNVQTENNIETSAALLFLNKTCYNGLYRENTRGGFNAPFGRYDKPRILDTPNLWAVHRTLQTVTLTTLPFEDAVATVQAGDFVYFDPPYHPLNHTSRFTNYTETDFREDDQRRLYAVFVELDRRGAFLMLSNSHTPFIQKLYAAYDQQTVYAGRAVNSKTSGRGKIPELVVRNFDANSGDWQGSLWPRGETAGDA